MSSTKDVFENHIGRFREGNLESPSPGKVAIVTGASSGIGLEMVKKLIEKGYRVVANSGKIASAGSLRTTDDLKLVDGDIGTHQSAELVAGTAIRSLVAGSSDCHRVCHMVEIVRKLAGETDTALATISWVERFRDLMQPPNAFLEWGASGLLSGPSGGQWPLLSACAL